MGFWGTGLGVYPYHIQLAHIVRVAYIIYIANAKPEPPGMRGEENDMSKFIIELGAGCYGGPFSPTVSEHKTWDAAVRKALKSDRLVAVNTDTGARVQIPQQNDRKLGAGRYGNGITVTAARKLGLI